MNISSYLACLYIWFRHLIFEYRELSMMLGNTLIIDFLAYKGLCLIFKFRISIPSTPFYTRNITAYTDIYFVF